jgi:NAD dependent epimerase/dehydratase family enzyme
MSATKLRKIRFAKGAVVIYSGQYTIPEKLIREGFEFKYPHIRSALHSIIVE